MASADSAPTQDEMDSSQTAVVVGVARQIPRDTLALLMVAQAAVILPYLQRSRRLKQRLRRHLPQQRQ